MTRTLDMKFIRYLNLFEKITKTRAEHCFLYNSRLVFLVPRQLILNAIRKSGKNTEKLSEILEKKVKIVPVPYGKEDIKKFIIAIVYPVKFKSLELSEEHIIINAGGIQNKVALIGRNKGRLNELQEILKQYFNIKEVRIT